MKRYAARALAVCFVVLFVAACRTAPIYNVPESALPTSGRAVSLGEVTQAIQNAGAGLGWQMREVRPGHMIGTLALRTHLAVVDVVYDTDSFSITYKDSSNLNHDGTQIHSNYNGWIQNLEQAIRARVAAI